MKWPASLTLIRHDESHFNRQKLLRQKDPEYRRFRAEYDRNPDSEESRRLARELLDAVVVRYGDHDTPLAEDAGWQAQATAEQLRTRVPLPEVLFVSPYVRAWSTLHRMIDGWPELADVRVIEEERVRERDHGLAVLYGDWRIFNVLNPEQRQLFQLQGTYWYRYPNGENMPDVRERLRSWLTTLSRDYAERRVMAITHHLAILSLRANLERLDAHEFIRLDEEEKPINSGVTTYEGRPDLGADGRLILTHYNERLY